MRFTGPDLQNINFGERGRKMSTQRHLPLPAHPDPARLIEALTAPGAEHLCHLITGPRRSVARTPIRQFTTSTPLSGSTLCMQAPAGARVVFVNARSAAQRASEPRGHCCTAAGQIGVTNHSTGVARILATQIPSEYQQVANVGAVTNPEMSPREAE